MFEEFKSADDNNSKLVTDRYWATLREMPLAERFARLVNLCEMTRKFAIAGILRRHPGIGSQELKMRLGAITLGRDFVVARYGWDPEVEGY